jgi:hypothetical protein
MLRISRAKPFVMPWIFRFIGAIRVEAFWAQLGGQQFVALLDTAGNRTVIPAPFASPSFSPGCETVIQANA